MKLGHLICAAFLLVAGGRLTPAAAAVRQADSVEVRTSGAVGLISGRGSSREEGRIDFRCRVERRGDDYMLLAKVMRNRYAMHVVRPGVRFELTDGGSVTLRPERIRRCCSSWGDGRWYNASFRISGPDLGRLRSAGIVSVYMTFAEGTASREVPPRKRGALSELIRSVDEK